MYRPNIAEDSCAFGNVVSIPNIIFIGAVRYSLEYGSVNEFNFQYNVLTIGIAGRHLIASLMQAVRYGS